MVLILAHRGIHHKFKENTLNSIIQIFNYKSNTYKLGSEIDINLTKDNKMVIYHDEEIKKFKINDLNYENLKLFDNEITLLEDVLIKFEKKDYYLNIELKEYPKNKLKYCEILLSLLEKYKNVKYILSSYSQDICNILNRKGEKCLKISEGDDKAEIQNYKFLNNEAKGVYTLFDKSFDESILDKVKNLNILITDDVDKLLNYLKNEE